MSHPLPSEQDYWWRCCSIKDLLIIRSQTADRDREKVLDRIIEIKQENEDNKSLWEEKRELIEEIKRISHQNKPVDTMCKELVQEFKRWDLDKILENK